MAYAIKTDQVRIAMRSQKCQVPDFTTRAKTSMFCSKVFISIEGDKLRFVELSFFARAIRYLTRGIWYSDTVFADKTTIDKVKDIVHRIKTHSMYQDLIAMDLLPLAKTRTELNCVFEMLTLCEMKAQVDRASQDVIDDIQEIQRRAKVFEDEYAKGGFSEEFLSAAIDFTRQSLKKDPKDKMWKCIERILNTSLNPAEVAINVALLREIMGRDVFVTKQHIHVPGNIVALLTAVIDSANAKLYVLKPRTQLSDHLKEIAEVEKLINELANIGEVMRPSATNPSGEVMVQQLREKFSGLLAHEALVNAYLGDDAEIVRRLYYHANLDDQVQENLRDCLQSAHRKIEVSKMTAVYVMKGIYKEVKMGISENRFLASCQRLGVAGNVVDQIVALLETDLECQKLIEARIKEDEGLKGMTYEDYCQDIKNNNLLMGRPEFKALSKITGRPVLGVKKNVQFEWLDGYNLDSNQEPLIFSFYGADWNPVVKKIDNKTFI